MGIIERHNNLCERLVQTEALIMMLPVPIVLTASNEPAAQMLRAIQLADLRSELDHIRPDLIAMVMHWEGMRAIHATLTEEASARPITKGRARKELDDWRMGEYGRHASEHDNYLKGVAAFLDELAS